MCPNDEKNQSLDRRVFCQRLAGFASLCGLGWVASAKAGSLLSQEEKMSHKFSSPSEWSMEQVFRFAFQNAYIPTMMVLAEQIGRQKFLDQLREAASEGAVRRLADRASRIPERDIATFANLMTGNSRMQNVLTLEVVEQTDRIFEMRVSVCGRRHSSKPMQATSGTPGSATRIMPLPVYTIRN